MPLCAAPRQIPSFGDDPTLTKSPSRLATEATKWCALALRGIRKCPMAGTQSGGFARPFPRGIAARSLSPLRIPRISPIRRARSRIKANLSRLVISGSVASSRRQRRWYPKRDSRASPVDQCSESASGDGVMCGGPTELDSKPGVISDTLPGSRYAASS